MNILLHCDKTGLYDSIIYYSICLQFLNKAFLVTEKNITKDFFLDDTLFFQKWLKKQNNENINIFFTHNSPEFLFFIKPFLGIDTSKKIDLTLKSSDFLLEDNFCLEQHVLKILLQFFLKHFTFTAVTENIIDNKNYIFISEEELFNSDLIQKKDFYYKIEEKNTEESEMQFDLRVFNLILNSKNFYYKENSYIKNLTSMGFLIKQILNQKEFLIKRI